MQKARLPIDTILPAILYIINRNNQRMQLSAIIGIAVLLFISFSIGVNLALHGVLSSHDSFSTKLKNLSNEFLSSLSGQSPTAVPNMSKGNPTMQTTPTASVPPPVSASNSPVIRTIVQTSAATESQSETIATETRTVVSVSVTSDILGKAMKSDKYNSASKIAVREIHSGPITSFVKAGGKFPIVMLTCNRPQLLITTVESLLQVRGVTPSSIVVLQDGAMQEVADIATRNNFKLIQNLKGLRMRGGAKVDGGAAIAQHYKFALTSAFAAYPETPAIIIVEDDLLFSPDFYEYMHATAPVLDTDKSAMIISAWNDNGFINKVNDPFQLRRTEYFPGLGWLLSRKLYKDELEAKWPSEHWDHWLRSRSTHLGREIIYPQVPRTFHNGIKGTFMTLDTHNKYFRDIAYNTNKDIFWSKPFGHGSKPDDVYLQVMPAVYEARIDALVDKCHHVKSIYEIFENKIELYCIWIDVAIDGSGYGPPEFEPIASFFGIWHEHRRGGHKGLHEFYWDPLASTTITGSGSQTTTPPEPTNHEMSYILLLNIKEDGYGGIENYKRLMPTNARVMKPNEFNKRAFVEAKRKASHIEGIAAPKPGMNCVQVCSDKGLKCRQDLFAVINTCPALTEKFSCQECISSIGAEQPAYVNPNADKQYFPGRCLISSAPEQSSCEASHQATYRLCACA